MADYQLKFDTQRGMLACRFERDLDAAGWDQLFRDLSDEIHSAHEAGPLRLLWDNRAGRILPGEMAMKVQSFLKSAGGPEDRIAVVVPNSLAKMQARPRMVAGTELFASENAALTWLLGNSHSATQSERKSAHG